MTTTRTPAEIDAEIAELESKLIPLYSRRIRLSEIAEKANRTGNTHIDLDRNAKEIETIGDQINAILVKRNPLEDLWGAQRWNRFYLVPGGKVHFSTHCKTCFHSLAANNYERSNTTLLWLTADSGRTVEDMIAEYGWSMCTVCFPNAPKDPHFITAGKRGQVDLDAKEAARALRQAKRDAKEANTPRDEEGNPLRLAGGDKPSTIKGASNAMAMNLNDMYFYRALNIRDGRTGTHPDDAKWAANAMLCAGAVARHAGLDGWQERAQELFDAATVKAQKKAKKDLGL